MINPNLNFVNGFQLAFTVLLVIWKEELVDEMSMITIPTIPTIPL
jgi:hypothetical protein